MRVTNRSDRIPAWAVVVSLGLCLPTEAQEFRRGDANADGALDLSDGSRTLGHLFLGQDAPPCLDAADADDSGELELTDAVFVFCHLFLGGPPPAAPGPEACGVDPSEDALECASYPACLGPGSTSFVFTAKGGDFTTPSGITITVPPGAVPEDTEVTIGPLSEGLDTALNDASGFSSHEKQLLGGFSGAPDGLTFAQPILVRMPVPTLATGSIAVPVSFDPKTFTTTVEASTLTWFGEESFAEFEVSHFSDNAVVQMEENFFQTAEGSDVPVDAPCRERQFTVINSAEDRAVSTTTSDCQAVSDFLLVVLDACGGQQERHMISDWNCDVDLKLNTEKNELAIPHTTRVTAQVVFKEFPEIEVRIPIQWENRTPDIATLEPQSDGFVTSSAIWTAQKDGGAAIRVSVVKPPLAVEAGLSVFSTRLETPEANVDVPENKTEPLDVQTLNPSNGEDLNCPLLWNSADPTIATVDGNGVVRGEKRGETVIRAHPTDPDGCPGGCAEITVNVIRNFEGIWRSSLRNLSLRIPTDDGPDLTGDCNLTSNLSVIQTGREGCGQFETFGTCTVRPPKGDPFVMEIGEGGFLAGVLDADDTFAYCTQRDDEMETCLHTSGTFTSDDSVEGILRCIEFDDDNEILAETNGAAPATRISPEPQPGTNCLGISGSEAITRCFER